MWKSPEIGSQNGSERKMYYTTHKTNFKTTTIKSKQLTFKVTNFWFPQTGHKNINFRRSIMTQLRYVMMLFAIWLHYGKGKVHSRTGGVQV